LTKLITMPARLWKSLTVRFMAPGHPLHEAERRAAAIVIDGLGISTIMGYRFSDAERERSPAVYSRPETRCMTLAGHCGIVPERVDRDRILLPCQLNPARPDSRKELCGITDTRGIFPAIIRAAPVVCW
jgi:hypothetical protein